MKKNLLIVAILLMAAVAFGSDGITHQNNKTVKALKTAAIDASDTIVFDLSQAIITGSFVEFPVYFHSDDAINALDFSFKYNHTNFEYDSIIDLTNYMQQLSYYNPNDSVVRFTSYSFQNYTGDSALVSIRFNILSGQFCSADINTIHAYLNGDACSYKVITCVSTGIEQITGNENLLSVYPNPANTVLNYESPKQGSVSLFDMSSKQIYSVKCNGNTLHQINTENLSNGVYTMSYFNELFTIRKKIVVAH